ncbi:MAG TPA: L-rhamnose mutarotase [Flavihumibacter sp.]|nr:L-rhamnose mutarotase [Flavihumibacter sp.]HPZ86681.1 L-rhamnose mutarotase [Flavihumibacter sp.]HQD08291.1 L-rhamnose mutarotase [Flavihumibacter sp.]
MSRYCLALDLRDDAEAIRLYDEYHAAVWPEIKASLYAAGVTDMEIYRSANRLFMIMETGPGFSFEAKAAADAANPRVQEWEKLMEGFQQKLPWSRPGEKWVVMEKVFKLGINTDV